MKTKVPICRHRIYTLHRLPAVRSIAYLSPFLQPFCLVTWTTCRVISPLAPTGRVLGPWDVILDEQLEYIYIYSPSETLPLASLLHVRGRIQYLLYVPWFLFFLPCINRLSISSSNLEPMHTPKSSSYHQHSYTFHPSYFLVSCVY
jgi:hypothetical protein